MQPKISVVMSVYNGTPYLRESIESILNQTCKDFEFIIIDDGSSDNTWKIITEYANQNQQIKLFKNEENIGLTKSLNKGLKLARGEYIARQDADDVSLPDRFDLQTRFLDAHLEVGAIGSSAQVIDEQSMFVRQSNVLLEHESMQACLLVNNYNCLYHSSMIVRRSLLQAVGGYREDLRYAQDYELWLRLSQVIRIENLPDVLVCVRRSNTNITKKHRQEQLQCAFEVSLKAVQESLKEPLDKDAYQRFWWADLRLSDEDAYQRFWLAAHGQDAQLQSVDIQRLGTFWQLLANHSGGAKFWGPRLSNLAYKLLHCRQLVEGLQLLWVVVRQLKMPIQMDRIFRGMIKPYVPPLGHQLWQSWQLKHKQETS